MSSKSTAFEAMQPPLVALVHLGDRLVVERGDAAHVLVRPDELVLRVRDLAVDAARREALRVVAELLEARLHDPHLVGLVVDREASSGSRAARPRARSIRPQAAWKVRIQIARACRPSICSRRSRISPAALFVNVIARISFGLHAVRADQVGDAVREHARLPGAGAGDDEQRAVDVQDGLALGRIEVGEEVLVGRDGSRVDASGGLGGGLISGRLRCFISHSRLLFV